MRKIKTTVVLGTRPEAIKLAPIISALKSNTSFEVTVCITGQHREMFAQAAEGLEITADYDLDIMRPQQTLNSVCSIVIARLEDLFSSTKPDWVIVQGDTTSAMAASLAAFHQRIRVAHVEAGLRTADKFSPFPEEINRRITSLVSDLHFAPTQLAASNLLNEGIKPESILVTGNPVIDSLLKITEHPELLPPLPAPLSDTMRFILLTAHRRENHGHPLREICAAVKELHDRYEELYFVIPVHLNPAVYETVHHILSGFPRILLLHPLEYRPFVHVLMKCVMVLTDSGGLQEEAPALNKPVLVLRDTTERPEGISAGTARLVGTSFKSIVDATSLLLDDHEEYKRIATAENPFGDGKAAARIVNSLAQYPL